MGFKWFSFDFLQSEERKQLQKLQVEEQDLKNELLTLNLRNKMMGQDLPYKKLIYTNGTITAVLKGGVVINRRDSDMALFQKVKDASSEDNIITLLSPTPELQVSKEEYTKEELKAVEDNIGILLSNPDFVASGDNIFLKGVQLPLVPVVLASFIELLEKLATLDVTEDNFQIDNEKLIDLEEKYDALKMFWRWLALNPIASSRQDCLTFIKKNNISITANGMLELYRRVINVGNTNKKLVEYVSEQYFKLKKWKKSPKNYWVYLNEEGNYELHLYINYDLEEEDYAGNLEELYLDLPNRMENIYTDAHTHTKIIRIGHVYKEDEDKVDLDNSRSCSRGLHVGSASFMFNGFGDTGVVALVNPMKVRSVPNHESNKMRVSEMFIVGVVELEEYKSSVDEGLLANYSQEYYNSSVEELEKELENKSFETLTCQENIVALPISNIIDIKNALKERIVKI